MFCFFLCEKVPMKKQTLFLFIQESQLVSTFNHRHQILIHRLGATTLPNLRTVTVQSPLKPALKSNTRQHVTVGSNFSINPLDGGAEIVVPFSLIDVLEFTCMLSTETDWFIIFQLSPYIYPIYTQDFDTDICPKTQYETLEAGRLYNKRKTKFFMALFDHLFAKLMTVKTVKSQL